MRIQATDKRLYEDLQPKYWTPAAEAVWRSTPELAAAKDEDSILIRDGFAVFSIEGPIMDTAPRVDRFFKAIAPGQAVRLDVNSPGGLVHEGTAIRTMIMRHEGRVVVQVMGVAASAAQYLTTGAKEVWMAEGASQMVHLPWSAGLIVGNYKDWEREAALGIKLLKKASDEYIAALSKKMGINDPARVAGILESETWYDADEAVQAGLASRVYPVIESASEASPSATVERKVEAVNPALIDGLAEALKPLL